MSAEDYTDLDSWDGCADIDDPLPDDVRIPICHGETRLVGGDVVYPHRADLAEKKFWRCAKCGAFVGCHPGTVKPLGDPATRAMRSARAAAHGAFDPLWQSSKPRMTRGAAYAWLSRTLGVSPVHIGELSEEQCERVVELCSVLRASEPDEVACDIEVEFGE